MIFNKFLIEVPLNKNMIMILKQIMGREQRFEKVVYMFLTSL